MTSPTIRHRTRAPSNDRRAADPKLCIAALRLSTEYVPVGSLTPPRRALRKHSAASLRKLQASIEAHGFLVPIIVDATQRIVAGHGRWLAAKAMGLAAVPVIAVSHLSDEQIRLFTICENKLGEDSAWDLDELRVELGELTKLSVELDLNIELSGFTVAEINLIGGDGNKAAKKVQAEEQIPQIQALAITASGNLWRLGSHRLICGSPLEAPAFAALLADERAEMVFSTPPDREAAMAIPASGGGEGTRAAAEPSMSVANYTDFLRAAFAHCAAFSLNGAIHYQCSDWRHLREMLAAGDDAYGELKNVVVWKKPAAAGGTFYAAQHELVFVWKNGTAVAIASVGPGATRRRRSDVWEYRGSSDRGAEDDAGHQAQRATKPTALVADAIGDGSQRQGLILDPFGGSGTTLVAAERTGRSARLIEFDPRSCDVIIRRWQALTGQTAVLEATGERFAEVERRVLGAARCDTAEARYARSEGLRDRDNRR